jgi:arsenate reductase (thioredoxin)
VSQQPVTVLFVCLHGAAKSLIAARYLERLAAARGVPLQSASAGMEADALVPPPVVAGLLADGIDASDVVPTQVTKELVSRADYVVSFGCDLGSLAARGDVTTWNDVPAVSDGYATARLDIVARVQALLDEIAASPDDDRTTT